MGVTVRRAVVFAAGLWCLLIAVQWAEFEWSRRRVVEALETGVENPHSRWFSNRDTTFAREARRLGWVQEDTIRIRRVGSKLRVEATVTRRIRWGGLVERNHVEHLAIEQEIF